MDLRIALRANAFRSIFGRYVGPEAGGNRPVYATRAEALLTLDGTRRPRQRTEIAPCDPNLTAAALAAASEPPRPSKPGKEASTAAGGGGGFGESVTAAAAAAAAAVAGRGGGAPPRPAAAGAAMPAPAAGAAQAGAHAGAMHGVPGMPTHAQRTLGAAFASGGVAQARVQAGGQAGGQAGVQQSRPAVSNGSRIDQLPRVVISGVVSQVTVEIPTSRFRSQEPRVTGEAHIASRRGSHSISARFT